MTVESTHGEQPRSPASLPDSISPRPTVVFTDVDDTLTWQGEIPVETFAALKKLRDAGFTVVPVTGASAGWCDCLIKTLPITHIIGENGALSMEKDQSGVVSTHFYKQRDKIDSDLRYLREIGDALMSAHPSIGYTQDQPFRLTDMAFDIGQTVTVPEATVLAAMQWLMQQKLMARRSSIHINVWLGTHSKATAAVSWMAQRKIQPNQCIFVGDSPNDESMFEQFPLSVGVANIGRFLESMTHVPVYITQASGGYGFVELTDTLIHKE